MSKIDLTINREGLAHYIQKAKENNIIIPTIAQMQNPDLIPEKINAKGGKGAIAGDAVYAEVEPIVGAITPVPGGVGSVTTSVLIGHVVEAAERTL